MGYATYEDMRGSTGLIATRATFTGHSLKGRWYTPDEAKPQPGKLFGMEWVRYNTAIARAEEHGLSMYVVISYWTPIAWGMEGEPVYVTPQRFSPTTSRQQAYVRAYVNYSLPEQPLVVPDFDRADMTGPGYAAYRAERERLGL